VFAAVAALADERRDLARQLITARETTLRDISRELHDEFGQLLTAMGSMLTRAAVTCRRRRRCAASCGR
jgi:glucose-6-phosphate-specific signal transduction histidine kinase